MYFFSYFSDQTEVILDFSTLKGDLHGTTLSQATKLRQAFDMKLFHVDQTCNSLTTVVYIAKNVVGNKTCFNGDLHGTTLSHATGLRHEFFHVNEIYNSLTTVVYDTKNVVGFCDNRRYRQC